MGLTNLTYGLYGGVVAFAVPQLLADRNISETAIAGLTVTGGAMDLETQLTALEHIFGDGEGKGADRFSIHRSIPQMLVFF